MSVMGGLKNAKKISLGVSTVETNQDRDRYFLICGEQLLKIVKIILTVETRLFFFSVEIFKIETFQLRLGQVEIFIETVEINRDCQIFKICRDFLRFIKIFQHY
jgi:hypothetical protein